MLKIKTNVRRLAYASLALLTVGATLLPALSGSASAAQVQARDITMSSSAVGATNTTYEVGFNIATTGAVQGVVVDFCSNTPIIGDSCTAPTGFTVGTPTVTTSGGNNTGLSGSWTAAAGNSGRTLSITNASGGSITAATPIIFTLSTATNPTTLGSFYARVFTFATSGAVTTWLGTTNGSSQAGVVDSGGIALSTAAQITVTAKVQETLTFCVYTQANCGAGGTAVTLGDTNGVLSTAGAFVDKTTKFDIATNAGGASPAATVRFKAPTLTAGSNTIATIGATGTASAPGTSQFGLCAYRATGTILTLVAPYNNGAADGGAACSGTTQSAGTGTPGGTNSALFAFDTTPAATTFGDDLATINAGSSNTGRLAFVGNVSPTQPAGIYTSTFTFVATAIY